jgi:hypothetical protein
MPLAKNEQKHLTAAQGYFEVGMPLDADAELELMTHSAAISQKSSLCGLKFTVGSKSFGAAHETVRSREVPPRLMMILRVVARAQ